MKQPQPPSTTIEAAPRPVSGQKTATGVFDTWSGANLWGTQTFTSRLQWGERYSQADPEWLESLLLESRFHMAYTPFVYSRNRPSVEIDPLGLMSFKYHKTCDRLSSTQRTALEAAASDAGRNAEKTPSCVSRSLESVKIRCGSCGNNCGRVFMGKFCINVELNEGGKCGVGPDCLASTILHELVHKCGGNEREAYGCEKRFYGGSCSFEVPDKYKPKCPKPCG